MLPLYFSDVDTYVNVEPSEFEDVFLPAAFKVSLAEDLTAISMSLDDANQFHLADEVDGLIKSLAAKYQGKTVTLNKPFRTPSGPKKFSVYVKNDRGNVVKVNFGDPKMEIKRDDPKRRNSFRARHNCDNPGPKWKARYWSCSQWRSGSKVSD